MLQCNIWEEASYPRQPGHGPAWKDLLVMNTFKTAGEAMLLAQTGQQQLAAFLAMKARRFASNVLGWVSQSVLAVRSR